MLFKFFFFFFIVGGVFGDQKKVDGMVDNETDITVDECLIAWGS